MVMYVRYCRREKFACHLALVVCAMLTQACLAAPPRFTPGRSLDMRHIRLELNVDIPGKRVSAVAALRMSALRSVSSARLDAVDFDVRTVSVAVGSGSAQPADYQNTGKEIVVFFPQQAQRDQELTVTIAYSVSDPKNGLHFFAPSDDDPDAPYQVWSQGESEENRFWIPCFDHPSERQTTELIVTTDARYQVVSNGKLVSRAAAKPAAADSAAAALPKGAGWSAGSNGSDAASMIWHWSQEQPHSSYLVTLAVGEFAVKEESWRGKPVTFYVPPSRAADIDRSFGNTRRMLDVFSDKIGVEYPWDKYAQVCCYQFGGGMENTSATTLGDGTLHDERAHLDTSSDDLVAHELAHQWWGDLVTCKDWAHLWLNEGFASYFEAVWLEADKGRDDYDFEMFGKEDGARRVKDRPIVDRLYEHADDMFDSRAYPKGAWVLHMLRCRLGDEQFWKALKLYADTHRFDVAETDDLRRAVEKVAGTSYERFFYDWTERPGYPIVDVSYRWNAEQKLAEVTVKQRPATPAKDAPARGRPKAEADADEPFHFPLALEFRSSSGAVPVVVNRDITELDTRLVVALAEPPQLFRVDPGNTLLKELNEDKGRDLWVAQLTGDPDVAGRIRAAQHLGKDKSDANRRALADALATETFWGVQQELAEQLGALGGAVARDALLVALGSGAAQSASTSDSGSTAAWPGVALKDHRVRRKCVEALGTFSGDAAAIDAVRAIVRDGDGSYAVEAAAIRALAALKPDDLLAVVKPCLDRPSHRESIRSAALNAIEKLDDPAAVELLMDWTSAGRPRECRRQALSSLATCVMRRPDADDISRRAVERLSACLTGGDARLRSAAAAALGEMGRRAESAIPALRAATERETQERARKAAKSAIEQIEKDTPAEQQLADLRKQLDALKDTNKSLTERLGALEQAERR